MSSSGMPARAAMPRPSPVLMKALVDEAKMRPAPPVAKSVALPWKSDDLARLHLERGHAEHRALGVAHEVERHPFDEELRLRAARCAGRACAASRGRCGPPRSSERCTGRLAEVLRVAAERALVDGAVLVAVEGHAEVLELDHHLGRHAAHELDRVLVAQPVGALDRVVHVPVPAVLAHVAERGARRRPAPPRCASASGTPWRARRP